MVAELEGIVPAIAAAIPSARFAFVGDRSTAFVERALSTLSGLNGRSGRADGCSPSGVAAALRACDLLVQPYPDGVTTRRTSVMAGLANAVPTVATDGVLTESVWRDTRATALVPSGQPIQMAARVRQLIESPDERRTLGQRGRAVYEERFSIGRTVEKLRAIRSVEAVAG